MEAISSSETSGASQRTTRRHIPEDDTLHNHRCENLKSYKSKVLPVEPTCLVYPSSNCNVCITAQNNIIKIKVNIRQFSDLGYEWSWHFLTGLATASVSVLTIAHELSCIRKSFSPLCNMINSNVVVSHVTAIARFHEFRSIYEVVLDGWEDWKQSVHNALSGSVLCLSSSTRESNWYPESSLFLLFEKLVALGKIILCQSKCEGMKENFAK
jgi:hypothetical protein